MCFSAATRVCGRWGGVVALALRQHEMDTGLGASHTIAYTSIVPHGVTTGTRSGRHTVAPQLLNL